MFTLAQPANEYHRGAERRDLHRQALIDRSSVLVLYRYPAASTT
jgi:hypothetical protein